MEGGGKPHHPHQRIVEVADLGLHAGGRASIGELLGCAADSVAVMGSTTHALYTVIMARQWAAGDELIISNLEHVCIASASRRNCSSSSRSDRYCARASAAARRW